MSATGGPMRGTPDLRVLILAALSKSVSVFD